MTARRSARPLTVAFAKLEPAIRAELCSLFAVLEAERPAAVRVWHRQDGITVRAIGRTADGMRISSVFKLRRG